MNLTRTRSNRISLVITLFWVATSALFARQNERPNIILIMADDLGYETIGANGGPYKTPNLDSLADTGLNFTHCYAQPLCTPTRVQIMTGIYNIRNYEVFGILPRSETTFAHLLKDLGYATAIAGKWQLGQEVDAPQHFGFDESFLWQHRHRRQDSEGRDTRYSNPLMTLNGEDIKYNNGEFSSDLIVDFINDFMERKQDQPFFVYYPMILIHCPFVPTPDSADWDPTDPGSETYKGEPKYFAEMMEYTDKMIGHLVTKLEELGLRENTLIMFTGDNGTDEPIVSRWNGIDYPGLKGESNNMGTHVPLIVNWPQAIDAGRVSHDLVDTTDFLPTIVDAAGGKVPAKLDIDGRSFYRHLLDLTYTPRDWIYSWYNRNGEDANARVFARNQRYKLYRNGEFYDIENDLFEENSIAKEDLDAEASDARKMLQKVIDSYKRPERFE